MKLLESIQGRNLQQRCEELKAQGAELLSLAVGSTNSEWILEYWFKEVKEEQQELI